MLLYTSHSIRGEKKERKTSKIIFLDEKFPSLKDKHFSDVCMANLLIYDQFMWRQMENYYGFLGDFASGSADINHSVWKKGIRICLNLMMPFLAISSDMSLRKITESYLELTIDPYFMEFCLCLAGFLSLACWLLSRYANEVNDKNQQKKAIYMLLC